MKIISIQKAGQILMVMAFFMAFNVSAQQTQIKKWDNNYLEFAFNPQKGTYAVKDKRNNSVCIANATFRINNYSSADEGFNFNWTEQQVTDELGAAMEITIEGVKPGVPSIILQIYLYKNRGCIVLNTGVNNTTANSLRVKDFSPIQAVAFKGFSFDDYKMLDGEGGAYFTRVSRADSLNCFNNLLATFGQKGKPKKSLVIGGLSYNEFQKRASVIKHPDFLAIELKGMDPVGKLVDAHSRYILKDKFYIDFTTDNRFNALESYGAALALANHTDIKGVDFPILNFWYAFVTKFGGDDFADNTPGTVNKMTEVAKTGFLKYSPIGLRLEPDDYALPNNQQGWWDDKHWQQYKGGQLLAPYETIVKWGTKIKQMGGVPFIYCQTAKRSEDYCLQYPQQMLFNNPFKKRSGGPIGWWGRSGDTTAIYWTYDFTDRGFIDHMQSVYQNLKNGGVQGIKFDYPDTGWSYDGGFDDKYATTTSAYRNIFRLAYNGLGPNRDVQERIPPFGDVALGVVTTQRTEGDNDRVYPGRVSKTGLRWYKNRMVVNYDCDPINPFHVYPKDTRDGWRAAITMTFTTSGRMEIGKYFEKMTPDMVYDLTRATPLLAAPALSAKPIDAFLDKLYPGVYDFTVKPNWHIVTFYNTKIEGEKWPIDVMEYWYENKQFSPKKMLPADIGVSLSDQTDDGGLGLNSGRKYYVFDFWNWHFIGKLSGSETLIQTLRPGEARVMALHQAEAVPQFIATNRHLLQGYLDMVRQPEWYKDKNELSGISKVVAGDPYKIIVAANGYHLKAAAASGAECKIAMVTNTKDIYEITLLAKGNADVLWKVTFDEKKQ